MSHGAPVHLPGLNGIRALAALAVVVSHVGVRLDEFQLSPQPQWQAAAFGVTVFFALSGFLITRLLLHERAHGLIQVQRFYLRRVARIWPLYWAYLAVAVLVVFLLELPHPATLWYYVVMLANVPTMLRLPYPLIDHFWSVAVEEQFYAVWPWVLQRRHVGLVIVGITVALLAVRLGARLVDLWGVTWPSRVIEVARFDCIAIGACGAWLWGTGRSWVRRIGLSRITEVVCWGILVAVALNRLHVASVIDHLVVSVATVGIIVNVAENPLALLRLEWPPLERVGRISYGVYVLHPLAITAVALLPMAAWSPSARVLVAYGGTLLLTVGAAALSYRYLEAPCMAWARRVV